MRPDFAAALLDKLHACLERFEKNWDAFKAVWTFSMLAARLLSLGPPEASSPCLEFLAACRRTCIRWLTALEDRASLAEDSGQRADYLHKCIQAALVCLCTFDVQGPFLATVLAESGVDFVRCLICVRSKLQPQANDADALLDICIMSCKRLAQRALPILARNPNEHRRLDRAVTNAWHARSDQPWQLEADCWASKKARGPQDTSYHLNLLKGDLLVDGHPPGLFPEEYEAHPHYRALFGSRRLDVKTSREAGMHFSVKSLINEYQVCLAMRQSDRVTGDGDLSVTDDVKRDLIVRATRGGAVSYFIPPRLLEGRVPSLLCSEFHYFFHPSDETVEFRPKDPWTSRPTHWRLKKDGGNWRISRSDRKQLLFPMSFTAVNVMKIFRPLEPDVNMYLTYHVPKQEVRVWLPRLKFDFSIEMGSNLVKSGQFRGMCVSCRQEIGTNRLGEQAATGSRGRFSSAHDPHSRGRSVSRVFTSQRRHDPRQGADSLG